MSMSPKSTWRFPSVLVMESVEKEDGDWIRRAEYPELPGCVAEAFSPLDAIDQLEEKRRALIMERLERGEPIPVASPTSTGRRRRARSRQARIRQVARGSRSHLG